MFAHGQTVAQLMERLAPKHYAVEGDRIGLQVGTLQKEIRKVLVALDVTDAVVDEAIEAGADLIIAHHAVIYRPLAKIDTATPAGRMYEKLIKNDIAVYIAHTNLDVADGGINDWMADMLGLIGRDCLEEVHTDKLSKLVVFVPEDHHERVLEALWQAGAGQIGHYGKCSFNIEGTGTFLPGEGTNPHIGKPGKLERTREIRVGRLDSVDDAFAWDEGEGDRSRDYWLREHRAFFQRTADRALAEQEVDALQVVFERFALVWPPER